MRPSWLLAVVVCFASPGCITALTFSKLERGERVAPREIEAVVTATAEVHVRAHYVDAPSRGWVLRPGGTPEVRRVAAGPLPTGHRLRAVPAGDAAADGIVRAHGVYHFERDGETLGTLDLDLDQPAPAWRTATAWALSPLTVSADLATFWVQAPVLAWLLSTHGLIST